MEDGSEYPVGHVSLLGAGLALAVPATPAEPLALPPPPAGPAPRWAAAHFAQGPAAPSLTGRLPWRRLAPPQPLGAWICLSQRQGQLGRMAGVRWLPGMGRAPVFLSEDPSQLELSLLSLPVR